MDINEFDYILPKLTEIYNTLNNNNHLKSLLIDNELLERKQNFYQDYTIQMIKIKAAEIETNNINYLYSLANILKKNEEYIKKTSMEILLERQFLIKEISIIFDYKKISLEVLQEIFYCYKYCVATSFFQNNIHRFIPEYDWTKIQDSVFMKTIIDGIMKEFDKLDYLISTCSNYLDFDKIPIKYISYLSHYFGFEKRDILSEEEQKIRELFKIMIEVYRWKGTKWSIELYFSFWGISCSVIEYYFDRRLYYALEQTDTNLDKNDKSKFTYYLTQEHPYNNLNNFNDEFISQEDYSKPYSENEFNELCKIYGPLVVLGYKTTYFDKNGIEQTYNEHVYKYFKSDILYLKMLKLYSNITENDSKVIKKYISLLVPLFWKYIVNLSTSVLGDLDDTISFELPEGTPSGPFFDRDELGNETSSYWEFDMYDEFAGERHIENIYEWQYKDPGLRDGFYWAENWIDYMTKSTNMKNQVAHEDITANRYLGNSNNRQRFLYARTRYYVDVDGIMWYDVNPVLYRNSQKTEDIEFWKPGDPNKSTAEEFDFIKKQYNTSTKQLDIMQKEPSIKWEIETYNPYKEIEIISNNTIQEFLQSNYLNELISTPTYNYVYKFITDKHDLNLKFTRLEAANKFKIALFIDPDYSVDGGTGENSKAKNNIVSQYNVYHKNIVKYLYNNCYIAIWNPNFSCYNVAIVQIVPLTRDIYSKIVLQETTISYRDINFLRFSTQQEALLLLTADDIGKICFIINESKNYIVINQIYTSHFIVNQVEQYGFVDDTEMNSLMSGRQKYHNLEYSLNINPNVSDFSQIILNSYKDCVLYRLVYLRRIEGKEFYFPKEHKIYKFTNGITDSHFIETEMFGFADEDNIQNGKIKIYDFDKDYYYYDEKADSEDFIFYNHDHKIDDYHEYVNLVKYNDKSSFKYNFIGDIKRLKNLNGGVYDYAYYYRPVFSPLKERVATTLQLQIDLINEILNNTLQYFRYDETLQKPRFQTSLESDQQYLQNVIQKEGECGLLYLIEYFLEQGYDLNLEIYGDIKEFLIDYYLYIINNNPMPTTHKFLKYFNISNFNVLDSNGIAYKQRYIDAFNNIILKVEKFRIKSIHKGNNVFGLLDDTDNRSNLTNKYTEFLLLIGNFNVDYLSKYYYKNVLRLWREYYFNDEFVSLDEEDISLFYIIPPKRVRFDDRSGLFGMPANINFTRTHIHKIKIPFFTFKILTNEISFWVKDYDFENIINFNYNESEVLGKTTESVENEYINFLKLAKPIFRNMPIQNPQISKLMEVKDKVEKNYTNFKVQKIIQNNRRYYVLTTKFENNWNLGVSEAIQNYDLGIERGFLIINYVDTLYNENRVAQAEKDKHSYLKNLPEDEYNSIGKTTIFKVEQTNHLFEENNPLVPGLDYDGPELRKIYDSVSGNFIDWYIGNYFVNKHSPFSNQFIWFDTDKDFDANYVDLEVFYNVETLKSFKATDYIEEFHNMDSSKEYFISSLKTINISSQYSLRNRYELRIPDQDLLQWALNTYWEVILMCGEIIIDKKIIVDNSNLIIDENLSIIKFVSPGEIANLNNQKPDLIIYV